MLPMLVVAAQLFVCAPPPAGGEAALRAGPDTKQTAVLLVATGFGPDLPLAEPTLGVTLPIDHLSNLDQPMAAAQAEATVVTRNEATLCVTLTRRSAREPLQEACLPPPRSV
ncbi:MAG TPA: hypothetical protein VF021_06270 [Longimicrobiales bacterium]